MKFYYYEWNHYVTGLIYFGQPCDAIIDIADNLRHTNEKWKNTKLVYLSNSSFWSTYISSCDYEHRLGHSIEMTTSDSGDSRTSKNVYEMVIADQLEKVREIVES